MKVCMYIHNIKVSMYIQVVIVWSGTLRLTRKPLLVPTQAQFSNAHTSSLAKLDRTLKAIMTKVSFARMSVRPLLPVS